MTVRREAIHAGDRELRRTARRFGEEFREVRLRIGVSQSAVARAIGIDRSVICRMERGDPGVGVAIRARACACLGADFRLQLYQERAPMIYDAAHARIVDRVLAERHRRWRATVEAPIPGLGRRSVDIRLDSRGDIVLAEVESHARRLEEIIRKLHEKQHALATDVGSRHRVHVLLVLPPTRHHQALVRAFGQTLASAFPIRSGVIREALASADLPWPGDGLLWMPGS